MSSMEITSDAAVRRTERQNRRLWEGRTAWSNAGLAVARADLAEHQEAERAARLKAVQRRRAKARRR